MRVHAHVFESARVRVRACGYIKLRVRAYVQVCGWDGDAVLEAYCEIGSRGLKVCEDWAVHGYEWCVSFEGLCVAYIVMASIVMASTVMAYIVMACIVMASVVMASIVMASIVMAYIVMACIVMACMAYIDIAPIVIAFVVMPCIVMAYIVMAYIVMTYKAMAFMLMVFIVFVCTHERAHVRVRELHMVCMSVSRQRMGKMLVSAWKPVLPWNRGFGCGLTCFMTSGAMGRRLGPVSIRTFRPELSNGVLHIPDTCLDTCVYARLCAGLCTPADGGTMLVSARQPSFH